MAILTGAGDRAFSAGADLVAMAEAFAGGGQGMCFTVPFAGITRGFECWKPIIAAINGYCLAGGLERRSAATSASPRSTRRSACRSPSGQSSPARAARSGCRAPCRSPSRWS